ncbi:hypothetical protein PAXRUDRAFT_455626 [Paxillus rubicundulus Ve08.2h10]|uniref:Uncharacterized protein n=1 Tax=Paxillus rubicundulus Ve08.2h10 TaxID=930991 RepID=A0A0D0DWQ8_9AGAM|nr:hypothetical protein PAXRUDRAFT_455626 [Paxillus rubicundulus Ve08.2h10]
MPARTLTRRQDLVSHWPKWSSSTLLFTTLVKVSNSGMPPDWWLRVTLNYVMDHRVDESIWCSH